jgi:hypothetical protein
MGSDARAAPRSDACGGRDQDDVNKPYPNVHNTAPIILVVIGKMPSLDASSANESPFLRLPVELRRAIYTSILPYVTLTTT